MAATLMLGAAQDLIRKNSPKSLDSEVRHEPPTKPGRASDARLPSVAGGRFRGVGIIEPVDEAVVIGSQVPGVVHEVCVKAGDVVRKGTPLLRLDNRSAEADLAVAQAELAAQKSRLDELIAQIPTMQARLSAAEAIDQQANAVEANAKREYERAVELRRSNALSEEEFDERSVAWETAKGKAAETRARVIEAAASLNLLAGKPVAATIEVQKAAVMQAEAGARRAETNLALMTLVAPSDGTILSVKIRAGEFMPASVSNNPFLTMGVIEPLHIESTSMNRRLLAFPQPQKLRFRSRATGSKGSHTIRSKRATGRPPKNP